MTTRDDSLARPKVTFGHAGGTADALEPMRWQRLPGLLFGVAALAALVAAIALVVTWPTHEVHTVPVNTPGTTMPPAATPAGPPPGVPQVAPPVERVVQQVPRATRVSPPANRAPSGGVPPIQSPLPVTTSPVITPPVVTTHVTKPVVTTQPEGQCTPPECITVPECTPSNCIIDPGGVGPTPGGGGATPKSGGTGQPNPIGDPVTGSGGQQPDNGGDGESGGWEDELCPDNLPLGAVC
jgi:hypothetical protein